MKQDTEKLKWSLLPWSSLEDVVKVLMFYEKDKGLDSWKKIDDAKKRYLDALLRHVIKYTEGYPKDEETGMSHLAHAACNILFLIWFENDEDINKQSTGCINFGMDYKKCEYYDKNMTDCGLCRDKKEETAYSKSSNYKQEMSL